ncbi:uncharacterized protein EKO05_0007789 [Ascochyta rabiei]|uniref:Uncharacterized protein n=1 Tax=Didymella rabiei TaxID=5454 RepID=A0A163F876_DIDRA|nr:uncharacterized protein EKO05_0007789 [Ascochyta rabiei]KZM24194.1 hypothetical protein ST47_g4679 [Ascochyta rabiei]UPX17435.1 hypothetical protein EKO05_0007789 [Ascochyta rabiei]
MERSIPALQQRTTSFNPEAATFSPVVSSPILEITESLSAISSTVAQATTPVFPIAPMFNYSLFQAYESMHSLYRRDHLTPAPVRLEEFLTPDTQALVRKLEEHPDIQEIQAPHSQTQETPQSTQAVAGTTTKLPLFTFPTRQPQSDYSAVDVNELSAGLGLPALKVDAHDETCSVVSQRSRRSQANPGALYGKLIGWALDKPLTAKGLAEFLQNPDSNSPSVAPAAASLSSTTTTIRQTTGATHSPSSFDPTQKLDNARTTFWADTEAPTRTTNAPKGSSAFQHQHRRSSNSSASFRHHTRDTSNRRYSRRASRAKRMDQGPMPSAADIYPEDANWTPYAPIHEGADYMSHHGQAFEQPRVIVDNTFNWPTPAQVYRPEPAPTTADIDDADTDVLALMGELPVPSLSTLENLGVLQDSNDFPSLDSPCDSRALTPAQFDGSRYGMKFHGIALGDEWELPKFGGFAKTESFRVRPREHDGWGGWEWALRKGWDV